MLKVLVIVAALIIIPVRQISTHHTCKPSKETRSSQQSADAPSVPAIRQQVAEDNLKPDAGQEDRGRRDKPVWVSNDRGIWDWIAYAGNLILSFVGVLGVIAAVFTLLLIKKQAGEMKLQR